MSFKLVKEVFDHYCSHVQFDDRLCKSLELIQLNYITRNEEHIAFFGGNLLGLQRIRFTESDRMNWFQQVLQMDEYTLHEELIKLPAINPKHKVSSDTFNLSCVWLIHRIYQAPLISSKMKDKAMQCVALMLLYRFFTSRYVRHFKYLTDRPTATATLNALSNKFEIKKLGSWQAVLQDKAQKLTSANSLHKQAIKSMDDNRKVVYMLNDTQNRIRAMLKGIYSVFVKVHADGIKVYSNASSVVLDGENMFRDKTEGVTRYTRYIQECFSSEETFIKPELVAVVEDANPIMNPRMFKDCLKWWVDNYKPGRASGLTGVTEDIIRFSYEMILEEKLMRQDSIDITSLIIKLRGQLTASKTSKPEIIELRSQIEKIAKKVLKTTNFSAIAGVRTGLVIYIAIRAFTMNYYTSRAKA